MKQYLDLMKDVYNNGVQKDDRTGTGTRSVFGRQMRFNLADGFPLLTTKKVHLKSIIYELLWMMKGRNDVKWLQDNGVTIWDEWEKKDGTIGPGYGTQWRSWPQYEKAWEIDGEETYRQLWYDDQLQTALNTLRENPNCRRNIVCSWNVGDLEEMALPPCHLLFQFYVAEGRLSCQMYQRSCDLFLGVPFNIASYSLLTMMMARMAGLGYGEFIWTGGDVHLYNNHMEQAKLQLTREPRVPPVVLVSPVVEEIDDWKYEDFDLVCYDPHPSIKADVSV